MKTDLPTPEEVAPRVLSETRTWWNLPVNRSSQPGLPGLPAPTKRRPFSAPSKYHAPRPVEAWTSGRSLTSGHVSPFIQSARSILQKYENSKRSQTQSRASSASDSRRRIDLVKSQPMRNHLKSRSASSIKSDTKPSPVALQSKSTRDMNMTNQKRQLKTQASTRVRFLK